MHRVFILTKNWAVEFLYFFIAAMLFFIAMRLLVFGVKWLNTQLANFYHRLIYHEHFSYYPEPLNRFAYYQMLNQREQQIFMNRLHRILITKKITGYNGLEITREMQVLVCASLTQLTFGFENYLLPMLREVHLYPYTFYSEKVDAQVKGLSIGRGHVMLSWYDFQQGYFNPTDKLNVGLHELAHNLWNYMNGLDSNFMQNIEQQLSGFQKELKPVSEQEHTYFRTYAFANTQEFWACCVESFFEAPVDFQTQHTELYQLISQVLQQDMATRWKTKIFRQWIID